MELRDLAERVLFGTSLTEKLAAPDGALTDQAPGRGIALPERPERPAELRFLDKGQRAHLPPTTRLHHDEDRGRLLHFFANHELLAAELMALVLLRFPDAPPAFRRGVAHTLMEEQEHTRLYMERMARCGVAFGSQPVTGFFWNSISRMTSPLDYVTGLSLTFEQANLDFSRHFSQVFAAAGDADSAALLERIYRDEINHVRYGLSWFRRWKAPGATDWESYQDQLAFPLSPARAKGKGVFNREGRAQAGLDAAFIDQLEVYSQSKGRTPNVHWFNPEAEGTVAHAGASTPAPLAALAKDLGGLTFFLARKEDIALVREKPGLEFLRKLTQAGFDLPEIQEIHAVDFAGRRLGELRPWAWSPDSWALLSPWLSQAPLTKAHWQPAWRELHSKEFSTRWRREILQREEPWPGHPPGDLLGQTCRDLAEVEDFLGRQTEPVVLKAPFGVAGRGHCLLAEPRFTEAQRRWLEKILATEGAVVAEPWLERVMDFSVQYDVAFGGTMRVRGYTRLHNDPRGAFRACSVERRFSQGCAPEVVRFFHGHRRRIEQFYAETLPATLGKHLAAVGFAGPLGVDAMLFRHGDGTIRHQPIVEINPRTTMGRVALELARRAVTGKRVIFEILTRRRLGDDFVAAARRLEAAAPLGFETNSPGKQRIVAGTLVLNDPAQATACLAVLRVGDVTWTAT